MLSPAKLTVEIVESSIRICKNSQPLAGGREGSRFETSGRSAEERRTVAAGSALAQAGAPSGRGAVTGDPAAGSATPRAGSQTTGTAAKSNPSGSGTSTSGSKDANGDAGRGNMPDSDRTVRPMDQQHHPEDK